MNFSLDFNDIIGKTANWNGYNITVNLGVDDGDFVITIKKRNASRIVDRLKYSRFTEMVNDSRKNMGFCRKYLGNEIGSGIKLWLAFK